MLLDLEASFYLWRGLWNVSQLIMVKDYERPSLLANFQNVPKYSQHLWRRLAPFERRASDLRGYIVPYKCVIASMLLVLGALASE